jgi:hypothetical protein
MTDVPSDWLIGRRLVDLLASVEPLVDEGLPGLERPRFYNVVLLLDGGEKFSLMGDRLEIWRETEKLRPVTAHTFQIDPGAVFRGQVVTNVSTDDVGDLIVELENQTTLQVVTNHGTRILVTGSDA